MINTAIITLQPVSYRSFGDVEVIVDVVNGNINRAVNQAIRRVSKTYPKNVVHRFDVLSVDFI